MSLDDRIAANRQQQRAMLERQQALLANIRRSQDSLLASSGTGGPDDRVAQASTVREDEFHGSTTSVSLDDLRTTQRSTREAHTAAASTGGHNSTLGGGHDGGSGLVAEMDAVLQRQSHSTSLSTSRRASATATATAAATATAVASRSTTTVHDRYSEVHGGAVSSAPSGVAGTAASAELLSTMTGLRTARSGNHNTTLPGEHGGHSDHHAMYDDRRGGSAALNMSHTSHASHRSLAEEAQSVDLLRQQLAHVHKIRADSQQKGVLVSQFREQLQELGRFKQQAFQLRSQVGSLEERLLNREAELARATAELSQRSQQLVATEQRFKQQLKLIDEAQQEEERRHAETVAQLRTDLARAREARAEAEARLDQQSTTLRSKLEQDATSLAEHNTTNHTLRTEIERLDVVVAEHRSDKQALRREVKTLRSELRTATEDATALRTDAVHLRRQLEELQLEHDRTTQRAAALEDEVATLPMLRQQLQSAADLEADLNTTAKELEQCRADLAAEKASRQVAQDSAAHVSNINAELEAELHELLQKQAQAAGSFRRMSDVKHALAEAQAQVDKLRSQEAKLREDMAEVEAQRSQLRAAGRADEASLLGYLSNLERQLSSTIASARFVLTDRLTSGESKHGSDGSGGRGGDGGGDSGYEADPSSPPVPLTLVPGVGGVLSSLGRRIADLEEALAGARSAELKRVETEAKLQSAHQSLARTHEEAAQLRKALATAQSQAAAHGSQADAATAALQQANNRAETYELFVKRLCDRLRDSNASASRKERRALRTIGVEGRGSSASDASFSSSGSRASGTTSSSSSRTRRRSASDSDGSGDGRGQRRRSRRVSSTPRSHSLSHDERRHNSRRRRRSSRDDGRDRDRDRDADTRQPHRGRRASNASSTPSNRDEGLPALQLTLTDEVDRVVVARTALLQKLSALATAVKQSHRDTQRYVGRARRYRGEAKAAQAELERVLHSGSVEAAQMERNRSAALEAEAVKNERSMKQLQGAVEVLSERLRQSETVAANGGELLEACFLLARAVAPLQRRYAEVVAQKRFLHREYLARLAVEQQAVMLMDAVQGADGESKVAAERADVSPARYPRRHCSTLRSAVLAVMAANRLLRAGADKPQLLGEALQARRSGPTVFLAADPVAEVRSHEADTANTHQESVNQSNGAGDGAQTGHADLLAEWLPLPQPREPAASTVGSRSPRSSAHGSVSGGQGHGRVYHMTRGEVPSGRASATASFAGASSVAHSRSPAISAAADRVVQLVQHFVPHAALEDNEGVGVGQGTLEWLYRGLQRSVRRHKSGAGASAVGEGAMASVRASVLTLVRQAQAYKNQASLLERDLATARVDVSSLTEQLQSAQTALKESQALASFLEERVHTLQRDSVASVPSTKLEEARNMAQEANEKATERSRALAKANESLAAHHAKILQLQSQLAQAQREASEAQDTAAKTAVRARARAAEVARLRQYAAEIESALGNLQVSAKQQSTSASSDKAELQDAKAQVLALRSELRFVEARAEERATDVARLNVELASCRQQLVDARHRARHANQSHVSQSASFLTQATQPTQPTHGTTTNGPAPAGLDASSVRLQTTQHTSAMHVSSRVEQVSASGVGGEVDAISPARRQLEAELSGLLSLPDHLSDVPPTQEPVAAPPAVPTSAPRSTHTVPPAAASWKPPTTAFSKPTPLRFANGAVVGNGHAQPQARAAATSGASASFVAMQQQELQTSGLVDTSLSQADGGGGVASEGDIQTRVDAYMSMLDARLLARFGVATPDSKPD